MVTKTNIFMTGVTGYIGGSVLLRFLDRSDFPSLHITALVRSPEKAAILRELGVSTVVGSHSDLSLVEKLASEANVVIAMADADDLQVARAILRGLEQRYQKTGTVPAYIHTSGTGVLMDNAAGMYAYPVIYDDNNPDQFETLSSWQPHRVVDLEVMNADQKGYVRTHIILPSTIYGLASGTLVDLGIQNRYSAQIPALIKASLDRKEGGMIGDGKNLWPNVHITDVARLYTILYDAIHADPAIAHGHQGIYFAENGEHTLYDVGKAISSALVDLGVGKSREPSSFSREEVQKYFGGAYWLGSNSRCVGNRSRSIGWQPVNTTADMLKSIKPEVEALRIGCT